MKGNQPPPDRILKAGSRRIGNPLARLSNCEACPRSCMANRLDDEKGACGCGRFAVVSSAFAHFGEERVLSGRNGSGTIFFAGCNLGCVFCQNYEISHGRNGRVVNEDDLARLALDLQAVGCHNINLVTPSHVVPQLACALDTARHEGLRIPVVYNTSAYDSPDSLDLLDGLVDVYMPDFKLFSPVKSALYLNAPDYPEVARTALRKMHAQVGDLVVGPDGLARRGLLVRHLVMPGMASDSAAIMEFLASLSPDTYVNIMDQYRPMGRAFEHPQIARRPSRSDIESALSAARRAGLHRFA